MPMPGPTSSHCRRSRGVAAASLGYHVSGTDTTRPSRSSTTSVSLVTLTSVATGASLAAKVLMPGPLNRDVVLTNQHCHLRQFDLCEPMVVLEAHRGQPELRGLAIARHV